MSNRLVSFGTAVTKEALEQVGMDIEFTPSSRVRVGNVIEAPCSIATTIRDINKFGAFSYINGRGRFTNVSIGRYCSIAEQVAVGYPEHPTNWLSSSTLQYQRPNWSQAIGDWKRAKHETTKPTEIGNDVWIGVGVFIRSGVSIGAGAIIGAHSVVTKDVEPYSIVVGNPARVVRKRVSSIIAIKLMELRWWEFSPPQLSGCDFSSPEQSLRFISELRSRDVPRYDGVKLAVGEDGAALSERPAIAATEKAR